MRRKTQTDRLLANPSPQKALRLCHSSQLKRPLAIPADYVAFMQQENLTHKTGHASESGESFLEKHLLRLHITERDVWLLDPQPRQLPLRRVALFELIVACVA